MSNDSDATAQPRDDSQKKRTRKRRVLRNALVGILILIIAFALTFSSIMSRVIASKLKSAVETRLRADLEFDSLDYTFPYSVAIHKVRFIGKKSNDRTTLLTIDELDLTLAEIPWPKKPVVIRNLDLKHPSIHVVRDQAGEVVKVETIPQPERKPETPSPPPPPKPQYKLSEMFELRRFTIDGGEIVYEDLAAPGAVPLAFRNINANLGVTPISKAVYSYTLTTNQEPYVSLDSTGKMDIDGLQLDVEQLAMKLEAKPGSTESPLPPRVQRVMNDMQITGAFAVKAKATVPLRSMKEAQFSADADLTDGSAILPRRQKFIEDLNFHLHADRQSELTQIMLPHLAARSGVAMLKIDPTIARFTAGGWSIERFSGSLIATPGAQATRPVKIAGVPLASGTVEFTGQASDTPGSKPIYSANVSMRDCVVELPNWPSPISALNGELVVAPGSVQITKADANLLGGHAIAIGEIGLRKPLTYQGTVSGQNLELSEILSVPKVLPNRKFSAAGKTDAELNFNGVIPTDGSKISEQLILRGTAEIDGAQIWDLPILDGVVKEIGVTRDGLKLSDAAARFDFRKRVITLHRTAINSDLLGVQGRGTIELDGELNLDIIAAPLGDWKKQIERTRIPIVSDIVGGAAAAVQKLVNTATSKLLYQFQVTGKTSNPQIKPIPAPILTDVAAGTFGQMLQQMKEGDLLAALKEDEKK
jgi:hypothetical protein